MPELTPETWAQIRYDYEHTDRPLADICAEHGISDGTLRHRRRRWGWTPRRVPVPREGPPAAAHAQPIDEGQGYLIRQDGTAPSSPPPCGEGLGVGIVPLLSGGAAPHDTTPLPISPPQEPAPGRAQARPGWGRERAAVSASSGPMSDPAAIAARLQSAVGRVLPAIEATLAQLAAGPQRPRELEQTARALGALMRTLRELNALLAQQPLRPAPYDDDIPEDIDAFRQRLTRRIETFLESRGEEEFGAKAQPTEESP